MDLFDPGTGAQVHDFNGGIAPSGFFWTVRIPDGAVQRTSNGFTVHADNLEVVDSFTFLGPVEVPATVSLEVTWEPDGAVHNYSPGSEDPTDPTNFRGSFRHAVAIGTFSGSNADGFSFSGTATSEPIWAEMGTERNGSFVP